MTLLLDADDVRRSIDLKAMVEGIRAGLIVESLGAVYGVPRINLPANPPHGFLRVMPVVIPELEVMGLKAFNGDKASGFRYLIVLWSVVSGELLAVMDAGHLTAARTGAVTAAATRALTAGRGHEEVGVIGSGLEARTNLEAICCVTDVERAKVFSPNREKRERFADAMTTTLGLEVRAVATPQEAADAPLVLAATNTGVASGRIALEGDWLRDAGHVSTIGSTMLELREVDAETFGRADLIVLDTEHAPAESGDLVAAQGNGSWDAGKVRTLPDLLADEGFDPTRYRRTVFKSVGTAVQDIVAAKMVYEAARREGRGETRSLLEPHFI